MTLDYKGERTKVQKMKRIVLYLLTCPQYLLHKIRGVPGSYDDLSTFFRYFPLGKINKDKTVSFSFAGKKVLFFYGHQSPMSAGIFGNKEYSSVPVEGKIVVDIGAALGDTAIYFCLKGAKKVYAYELNERHFNIARKNIELNDLNQKVNLEYCGVASKKITSTEKILGALMPIEDVPCVEDADFKTLDQIVMENNINDAVLKVDVDGFEYEIIGSTSKETLRRFEYIFMEYHFGVQRLGDILSCAGFAVTNTPINKIHIEYHPAGYKEMDVGFLTAKRID